VTISAREAALRLRRLATFAFPREERPPHGPAGRGLLRVILRVRDWVREDFKRNRSITRRIWGSGAKTGKKGTLEWFVFVGPIRRHGDALGVTLEAKGLPAMIEQGGQTREHMIRPRKSRLSLSKNLSLSQLSRYRHRRGKRTLTGGGVLAWEGPGGMVFRRIVSRHSAKIPKAPVIAPLWDREVEAVPDAVDRELQEAGRRIIDGG